MTLRGPLRWKQYVSVSGLPTGRVCAACPPTIAKDCPGDTVSSWTTKVHGKEWNNPPGKSQPDDSMRCTDSVRYEQHMSGVELWEHAHMARAKDDPTQRGPGWDPSLRNRKLNENLDGSHGKKVASSTRQSVHDITRCVGHIWTPDIYWGLYSKPPTSNGVSLPPKEYMVDEGEYVTGWLLPTNLFPPPPGDVTHPVVKRFTTGDQIEWERMRSDCETHQHQTDEAFQRMAMSAPSAEAMQGGPVDAPSATGTKRRTKARLPSAPFEATVLDPVGSKRARTDDPADDAPTSVFASRFCRRNAAVPTAEALPHFAPAPAGSTGKKRRVSEGGNAEGGGAVKLERCADRTIQKPLTAQQHSRMREQVEKARQCATTTIFEITSMWTMLQGEAAGGVSPDDLKAATTKLTKANSQANRKLLLTRLQDDDSQVQFEAGSPSKDETIVNSNLIAEMDSLLADITSVSDYVCVLSASKPVYRTAGFIDSAIAKALSQTASFTALGFTVPLVMRIKQLAAHIDLVRNGKDLQVFVQLITASVQNAEPVDYPAIVRLHEDYSSTPRDLRRLVNLQSKHITDENVQMLMESTTVDAYLDFAAVFGGIDALDTSLNDELVSLRALCATSDSLTVEEFQAHRTRLTTGMGKLGKPLTTWAVGRSCLAQWKSTEALLLKDLQAEPIIKSLRELAGEWQDPKFTAVDGDPLKPLWYSRCRT